MKNRNKNSIYSILFFVSALLISISVVSSIGVIKNKSFYFEGYIYNNYLTEIVNEYCASVHRFLANDMTDEEKDFFQKRTNAVYYYLIDGKTNEVFTNIPNDIEYGAFSVQPNILLLNYKEDSLFTGNVLIDKNAETINQSIIHSFIASGFNLQKVLYIETVTLVISFLFGIILFLFSFKRAIKDLPRLIDSIPIDVRLFIIVADVMGWAFLFESYMRSIETFSVLHLRVILGGVFIGLTFILLVYLPVMIIKIRQYIADYAILRREWENRLTKHTSAWLIGLAIQLIWYFIVLSAFSPGKTMYEYVNMIKNNASSIVWHNIIIAFVFLLIRQIQRNKAQYLKKILNAAKEIADGNFGQSVPVIGNDDYAQIAQEINTIKEGYAHALDEQRKSERLKYELVTNISHDLRTPLTSILNYIELAKKNGTPKEEIARYIGNAEVNAKRLNVLIEDLFELSKMESGNVQLDIAPLDIILLLKQVLYEYREQLEQNALEPVLEYKTEHITWLCDNLKIWRLFDNIIYNAVKYSLSGTRIYIIVEEKDENGAFSVSVKNISNYKMNFEPEELFLRFKRGDEARETEGSGLGLAIAKSIVALHNGCIRIETEGDMFKVIVQSNGY